MNNMNDNRSYSGLVEKYIGTAYDTVKLVADAILGGWLTSENVQSVDSFESFLNPDMRNPSADNQGVILDLTKPYFLSGTHNTIDGTAGYYSYLPDQDKRLANGYKYIDPSVPMSAQGQGSGVGIWVRQTPAGGSQGVTGNTGDTGPRGLQGIPGNDGLDGSDGAGGTNGADGKDGLNGAPGTPGAPGIAGTNGTNGTDGSDGRHGTDGHDGIDGVNGATGIPGSTGPAGPGINVKGRDTLPNILAKTGMAAGDLWVSSTAGTHDGHTVSSGDGLFYDGSIWDYAGAIQGSTGRDGQTGQTGATGSDGSDGGDGVDGQIGATGPAGQQGPPGLRGLGIRLLGAVATSDALKSLVGMQDGDAYIANDTGFIWLYDADLTRRIVVLSNADLNALHWYDVGHVQGPQGNPGVTGAAGATGPRGASGQTGAPGPAGTPGQTGATGAAGPTAISANADNQAVLGTDGLVFVPAGATSQRIDSGSSLPAPAGYKDGDIFFVI